MPNIEGQFQPLLSDFTYGELSPRLLGRSETAVYHKGAQTMQNFVPLIQGGFRKRSGTVQIGNVYATILLMSETTYMSETLFMNQNPYVRLRNMTISGNLWYLLEFSAAPSGGTSELRIWGNMNTTPSVVQSIAVPYTGSELAAIQFGWAYPNLFIAHGNHPPAMLSYVSLDTFSYTNPIPLVGSAASYLTAITLTSGNAYFPITGQQLLNLPSTVVLPVTLTANGTTALTVVTPNPLANFWSVVGKYIFITGDSIARQITAATATTLTLGGATSVSGTAVAAYIANTGLPISAAASVSTVWTSVLPAACYLESITTSQVNISSAPSSSPTGVVVAISQDIIPVSNSPSTPDLPFQSSGNYPSSVACANQRVLWMGLTNAPEDVWSTVVGIWDIYGNMEIQLFELVTYQVQVLSTNAAGQPLDSNGNVVTAALQNTPAYTNVPQTQEIVGDADGFNGSIFSDQNDSIQWAVSAADIIIGTLSGQVEVEGTATANTYAFRNVSRTGCAPIQGYFMTGGVLFVDRAAKRVLLLNWQGSNIETPPPETLSIFSEHLFEQNAITQIAYASSPVMRLWFLRTDGTLVCCEYDAQYDAKAWWQFVTTGTVLSLAIGPNVGEDDVYVAVSYNGKVILEQLSSPYWNTANYSGSGGAQPPVFLDHAVQYYNATPFTALTAVEVPLLANLNGQTVSCWGDGAYLGTAVVALGAVTLPMPTGITSVHYAIVGMPYTSTMTSMPFDVGDGRDSTRGDKQNTPRVAITLLNSLDGTISGKPGGQAQYAINQSNQVAFPTLYTGTKRVPVSSGIGFDATITVTSALPLPCSVTSIVPMVGDRERA